jgi:hypothetical protein
MLSYEEVAGVMDVWADTPIDDFDKKLSNYLPQGAYERMMLRISDSPTIAGSSEPGTMLGGFMAGFELGWEMAEAALRKQS